MRSLELRVVCVGKPGRLLAAAIAEYEARAGRYFGLRVFEAKAGKGDAEAVRADEAKALLARLPPRGRVFALTRDGERLDTRGLADELSDIAAFGPGSASWLIGGAFGLSETVLAASDRRVSLSDLTLPHELVRLVLAEQLYRAGTILRGEPYHKGG
ncbi:MAG: 23S rRNA (pseudouridine(1915)-N(3))-methyltransferase RlmH [Gemmatimonadota bacterium]